MNIEERFGGEVAGRYDEGMKYTAFGYDSLHSMIHPLLKPDLSADARLLVVGAGTGKEIELLGREEPAWSFTGVDPSSHMLAVARRRLAPDIAGRTKLRVGYVKDLPESDAFDAATALLVMHFLPDDGSKLDFLKSIAERTRPGGTFVLADLYGETGSDKFEHLTKVWRLRQRYSGMSEEDTEKMFDDLRTSVYFVPEERIVELLLQAGFTDIGRFHTAMLFGGWFMRR